jgi:hypothetical protein
VRRGDNKRKGTASNPTDPSQYHTILPLPQEVLGDIQQSVSSPFQQGGHQQGGLQHGGHGHAHGHGGGHHHQQNYGGSPGPAYYPAFRDGPVEVPTGTFPEPGGAPPSIDYDRYPRPGGDSDVYRPPPQGFGDELGSGGFPEARPTYGAPPPRSDVYGNNSYSNVGGTGYGEPEGYGQPAFMGGSPAFPEPRMPEPFPGSEEGLYAPPQGPPPIQGFPQPHVPNNQRPPPGYGSDYPTPPPQMGNYGGGGNW